MKPLSQSTRHWGHIVLSLTLLILSISLFSMMNQQPLPDQSYAITATQSLFSNSEAPPPADAHWQHTTLPDDWFRKGLKKTYKWYRFELTEDELAATSLSLYLTLASRPTAIYIDNHPLVKPQLNSQDTARIWSQPQLVNINYAELKHLRKLDVNTQKRTVMIRLAKNQSSSGMLGIIYVGAGKPLMKAFNKAFFVKVHLVRLLVVAMILSSLFVIMLWVFRHDESLYAFYAVAIFMWALYSYSHIPTQLPVSSQSWEWMRASAMVCWSVSIALFCNRFLDSPQPAIEKLLVLQAIIISLSLLFVTPETLYWLADFVFPAYATALGLYPSYRMLTETLRQQNPYLTWLTMCGMMVMLLAAHDIAVMAHLIPPWQGLYLHYAALILLVVFNLILIKRFVDTLNEVETLNKSLEQRVEEKSQQLKANYVQLHRMQREKDLNNERERIMHDMHDGVGGTLVSLRAALERGNWSETDIFNGLGNALDDLYLMIHSLDPYGADLTLALGSIRHTLENRLRRADIKLQWIVREMPVIAGLNPAMVLSIMRIMQEAIANIIKHSNASEVIIRIPAESIQQHPSTVDISITDNGCGIDAAHALRHENQRTEDHKESYGLSGMQSRAEKIAARISVQPANPGTQILLTLPVAVASSK